MNLLPALLLLLAVSGCAAGRILHQAPSVKQEGDKINTWTQLPIGPKLNSQFHSGYLTVNATKGRKFFYVFGEAETDPKTAPLIFWMNGGPGCSSVGLTFLKGSGPFMPVSNATKLLLNKNSFTRFANVIWMEQPFYTGFSTSNDPADRITDDTKTGEGMLTFLLKWFERFPEFKDNKLFLAGQSYAGHYGPLLAKRILDYNAWAKKANQQLKGDQRQHLIINLGGLAMGNAWTDAYHDNTATLDFWHDNALISKDVYEGLLKCDMSTGALWRTDGPSGFTPECEKLRNQAHKQIGTLNQYGLNAPVCVNSSDAKYPAPDYENLGWELFDPCANKVPPVVMNDRSIQLALGAIEPSDSTKVWKACVGAGGLNYSTADMVRSMKPVYAEIVGRGLPVIFYNGETDSFVPLAGSREWVESLNLPLLDPNVTIRTWKDTYTGQPGGSVVEYKGLTRVSVRQAGHSLASWVPWKNSQIVRTFVEGGRLPTFVP